MTPPMSTKDRQALLTPTSLRNLKSLPRIGTQAYNMLIELKSDQHSEFDRVFVGGGGNYTGQYREWMVTEDWEAGVDWEQVNLA